MCYTLLPSIFDNLRGVEKKSIVMVVSPLLALMKDQVANISAKGITAVHISDREKISRTKEKGLLSGDFQVVFVSPESLFRGTRVRNVICSNLYRKI